MSDQLDSHRYSFASAALPSGASIVRAVTGANMVVLEIALPTRPPVHRLYWRPIDAEKYAPIDIQLTNLESTEQLVLGTNGVGYALLTASAPLPGGLFGGRATALVRVVLDSNPAVTRIALPTDMRVHQLIRVNDDGTVIDMLVHVRVPAAKPLVMHAEYYLASYDVTTQRLTRSARLHGVGY